MISFIIIGYNEGWRLENCLNGVYSTILKNRLNSYEVIYIDSGSSDNSIEIARKRNNIKIFKIDGKRNAATARNIGALESEGDVLFFIDGDVELEPKFLSSVYKKEILQYDCVSGYLENIYHDDEDNIIERALAYYKKNIPTKAIKRTTNGGIFLIKRKHWDLVNGMKTKYKTNEDFDLALRMSRKGIQIYKIPVIMGKHYTVDYRNYNRMWRMLKSGNFLYPGILAREHFFNIRKVKHSLRVQYTPILLIFAVLCSFINIQFFIFSLILFLLVLAVKVLNSTIKAKNQNNSRVLYFFERFIFQILHDLYFLYGFLFFYPSNHKLVYSKV